MATTKKVRIKKTLYKALKYITNPEKTDEEVLISGINGCSKQPQIAFRQMRFTKLEFNKKDKIQAHHFIQSFKPGEVSPEVAHEIGMKWAKEIFGENFQGILSTHSDKEHIHNHIVINSVSHIDGRKYYSNDKELNFIRGKSDKLCLEYGLSVIEEKETGKNKESKKKTKKECQDFWKNAKLKKQEMVKDDIDATILNANDFDDFIAKMKRQGYEIKYGRKHISFRKMAEQAVRGTTIGEEYSEENIRKRIKEKELIDVKIEKIERTSLFSDGKNKANSYANKSYPNNQYTIYPKGKKYYCKNKNIFITNKKYFKPNIFKYKNSYGRYRWNYTRPSARNSLLVLFILLKTKKNFEQKREFTYKDSNKASHLSSAKIRFLKNNIKNIEENLKLMSKYNFENLNDVNKAIEDLETNKKENFNQIKILEKKQIEKKLINDLIDKYIEYKPNYVLYKKNSIKTKASTEFVKIYNILSDCGIDSEIGILEFRTEFNDILEDMQNEIIDIKSNNTSLNKEKDKLEKIKESIIDMKQDSYEIIKEKEKNIEKQNKRAIEKKQDEM